MTTHSNQSPNNPKKDKKGQMANSALQDHANSGNSTHTMEKPLSMVNSPIIMTDSSNLIIFSNASADDFFHRHEESFKSVIFNFQADSVLGLNMSSVPQTTTNTGNAISSMSDTYQSQVNLNGQSFTLLSTPLIEAGVHQGTLIEWIDDSDNNDSEDLGAMYDALNKVQGIIQFEPDGTIITANENFVGLTGYSLDEIQGRHHSLFVDESTKFSAEYKEFWNKLAAGEAISAEFKRYGKDGKEVWINASYNPVFDSNGKVYKVVKFATDITDEKLSTANIQGQVDAISKVQAVIEFNLDGSIITANDNFLQTLGYDISEIQGKHHSMFVEESYKESLEYKDFWEKLNRGEFISGDFKRISKDGSEIWIKASYNPILDMSGNVIKVVKFAIDITQEREDAITAKRISRSLDKAGANVIVTGPEFTIDYMNDSIKKMFKDAEHLLKEDLPNFDADNLYGLSMDVFHKNPDHQRELMESLTEPHMAEVVVGGIAFKITTTPVFDDAGDKIGTIMEWEDRTEANAQAIEAIDNARIKASLDKAGANVIVTGPEFTIDYMNDSIKKMFKDAEHLLKQDLPNFDANNLYGLSMDVFHVNPTHQRGLMENLTEPHRAEVVVGGIAFRITTTPIFDDAGDKIGTIMEWEDRTEANAQELESVENSRIKASLDKAGANVIVTGPEFTIDYMNDSIKKMFKDAEHLLKQDLPQFNADDLYGKSMDIFHKNPSHQRSLMDGLTAAHTADVVVGGIAFRITTTPIFDDAGDKIGTIMEWEDRTEANALELESIENARIKQALDKAGSNVIVCGADNSIAYLNESIQRMFAGAESTLRQELPHFNSRDLLGKSMDEFHKNPSHQINLIDNLTQPHTATVSVAGITFKITTTPISDHNGKRLGTIMEWVDRTQELAVEDEVASIVDQALQGDLTQRISLDAKQDFFLKLSEGINDLMEINQQVVEDTIAMFSAMADGDLSKRIDRDYSGSFDTLKNDANATVENLIKVIANIKSGSTNVKSASGEIAEGNLNLSQRTEQQAASLEETASSMEEMTATIMQNTESAHNANKLASATAEIAETGGKVVSEAITAMGTISESSNKIADIISVIDEIAFQTNLLALNASVEAARAGEQGRGFAVVAGEVRNLAGRSATAAKEIKELIEDSGKKVEEGKQLVNRSGESLTNIVSSVKEVSDLVAEIASASEEQSQGITEVNKAVARMDEMTQQNAALVEEVASSSDAMGNLAVQLEDVVSFFKIDDEYVMNSDIAKSAMQAGSGGSPSPRQAAPRPSAPAASNPDSWEEF